MTKTEAKVTEALSSGPLLAHELAAKSWRYSSNGGPPGWVMPLGRVAKRMKLKTWLGKDYGRMYSL